MKKILALLVLLILISGCGNKKYAGYWCRYDETATIVVLLNRDVSSEQKKDIESKINSLDNITAYNYYSREDYAKELGQDVDDLDIYDNYVISFNSMESIGTYVSDFSIMKGVKEAKQVNAKQNVTLYNINKNGTYTFQNSDEAKEDDIIKGKYKVKKGVIIFTPSGKDSEDILLYTKDDHLCEDADCTKIYFKSDESCNAK